VICSTDPDTRAAAIVVELTQDHAYVCERPALQGRPLQTLDRVEFICKSCGGILSRSGMEIEAMLK
jgi:hypothetical protein